MTQTPDPNTNPNATVGPETDGTNQASSPKPLSPHTRLGTLDAFLPDGIPTALLRVLMQAENEEIEALAAKAASAAAQTDKERRLGNRRIQAAVAVLKLALARELPGHDVQALLDSLSPIGMDPLTVGRNNHPGLWIELQHPTFIPIRCFIIADPDQPADLAMFDRATDGTEGSWLVPEYALVTQPGHEGAVHPARVLHRTPAFVSFPRFKEALVYARRKKIRLDQEADLATNCGFRVAN